MKKFLSNVSVVSLAGMMASGVAFAGIDVSNENTGADSDNENTVDVETEFDEDVTNSAEIENEAEVSSETGDNAIIVETGVMRKILIIMAKLLALVLANFLLQILC